MSPASTMSSTSSTMSTPPSTTPSAMSTTSTLAAAGSWVGFVRLRVARPPPALCVDGDAHQFGGARGAVVDDEKDDTAVAHEAAFEQRHVFMAIHERERVGQHVEAGDDGGGHSAPPTT